MTAVLDQLQKLARSRAILVLRESFLALLPVFIMKSGVDLVLMLLEASPYAGSGAVELAGQVRDFFDLAWPLALALTLAIHSARSRGMEPVQAMLLVGGLLLFSVAMSPELERLDLQRWLGFAAVPLPLLALPVYDLLARLRPEGSLRELAVFSPALARAVRQLLPFTVVALLLAPLMAYLPAHPPALAADLVAQLPVPVVLLLAVVFSSVLWWLGVHGSSMWNWLTHGYMFDHAAFGDATFGQFVYTFAVPGGSGAALALGAVLWLQLRDSQERRVLRWSAPFLLFNISEPLVYGLPVVGCRQLLLPFVLAPVLGVSLAWVASDLGWLLPSSGGSWMNPAPLRWLRSPTPVAQLLVQSVSFALCMALYWPFVRRWRREVQLSEAGQGLARQMQMAPQPELASEQAFMQRQQLMQDWSRGAHEALALVQAASCELHYQPKLDLGSQRIHGVEALLRLQMPDGSRVSPGRVLPALERVGLGDVLDLWAVQHAIEDARVWRAQGLDLNIAVNLNATTLLRESSFARLMQMRAAAPELRMNFELLESSLVDSPELMRERVAALQAAGSAVHVDDFGTGYSNLALFHAAAFDLVKIDRSLLLAIGEPRGRQLYAETCAMLGRLGYPLLAEGVETEAELQFVRDCGVHAMQGFWLAPALPAVELPRRVAELQARLTPGG